MTFHHEKCVMILDEALPLGILANTAGILGITLGKYCPETVGPDVFDKSGNVHRGIVQIPVPILKANQEKMKALRKQLYQPEFADLVAVDFSNVAQSCKIYDEYTEKAENTDESELVYLGIGICGEKKLVSRLTGNLPLLR